MHLIQYLLNTPPFRNARFILDNKGSKYWISWSYVDGLARVLIIFRGKIIGIANLILESKHRAELAEINIFKKENSNTLRRRGLGKAIMKEVIKYAFVHRVKTISGLIKPHAGESLSYLKEWYRRQDFTVTKTNKQTFRITMNLSNKSIQQKP